MHLAYYCIEYIIYTAYCCLFQLTIPCKEICAITKEKTARVIPNAIQIATEKDKYFFTSFGTRDKTFMMLFRIWQNALMDQVNTLGLLKMFTMCDIFLHPKVFFCIIDIKISSCLVYGTFIEKSM